MLSVKTAIRLNEDKTLEILHDLKEGISGAAIAKKLNISRTAVWKSIEKLRNVGYEIESYHRKGYRLIASPEISPYSVAEVCLKTGFNEFVDEIHYFKETDSTNLRARELSKDRVLLIAESQKKGRGRMGREWLSDKGGLYFSANIKPGISIEEVPKITITTGVAVCESLKFASARLKWPNDVLINGKKVSGILCELGGETDSVLVTVGVGINVKNPVELNEAIYLREIKDDITLLTIFENVLKNLKKYYTMLFSGEWNRIRERWKELSDIFGREVKVRVKGREYIGIAVDLDADGGLLLKVDSKIKKIYSGDCFYV
jgi:BirA family biotin operon repressor/biotin-[acetyl-CoA-carboxylase] ligase